MDFNGIRRLYLPLRPKARFSPRTKDSAGGIGPVRRPAAADCLTREVRGRTLSRPLSATVYGKYDMPSLRLYERIAQGLISACRKHVVAATRPSPFKVGDNQRPERTMSGVRKPSPESSVPDENLDRGSRRNQFWRGHGSPSVLNEVFSNLARLCASKCKRSP